jgi:hypothetical protein
MSYYAYWGNTETLVLISRDPAYILVAVYVGGIAVIHFKLARSQYSHGSVGT